jgi:hypothetical protein
MQQLPLTPFQIRTIQKLRAHALEIKNYNKGWDVIVEAYTDEKLLRLFNGESEEDIASMRDIFPDYIPQGPATTYLEAKQRVKAVVDMHEERRREIESTIW